MIMISKTICDEKHGQIYLPSTLLFTTSQIRTFSYKIFWQIVSLSSSIYDISNKSAIDNLQRFFEHYSCWAYFDLTEEDEKKCISTFFHLGRLTSELIIPLIIDPATLNCSQL